MLISIEGIDGSGKSTILEELKHKSDHFPQDVIFTKEPTDSPYGKLLRENLASDDTHPMTELFLFMTDHAHHIHNTIQPALASDKTVVTDRYIGSRCAYQAYTLNDIFDTPLEDIYNLHSEWSIIPDLTLYLDVSVETALSRVKTNHKYETKKRLSSIKANYDALYQRHQDSTWAKINADQPIDDVVADCLDEIKPNKATR